MLSQYTVVVISHYLSCCFLRVPAGCSLGTEHEFNSSNDNINEMPSAGSLQRRQTWLDFCLSISSFWLQMKLQFQVQRITMSSVLKRGVCVCVCARACVCTLAIPMFFQMQFSLAWGLSREGQSVSPRKLPVSTSPPWDYKLAPPALSFSCVFWGDTTKFCSLCGKHMTHSTDSTYLCL